MNVAPLLMIALDRRATSRWSAPEHDLAAIARRSSAIDGLLVLRTCERFEIYVTSTVGPGFDPLRALNVQPNEVIGIHRGIDVIRHVFRVASGLESRLIGETHVLGQVRRAANSARDTGAPGPNLNALFAAAIQCGRRVRRDTELGRAAASYAGLAVERVVQRYSSSSRRNVAIIGTGAVAAEIGKRLREHGCGHMFVIGRHQDRTRNLAASFNAFAAEFNDLSFVLQQVDAVIAATSAPSAIIRAPDVARLHSGSCIIDLGMPPNVEEDARAAHNVAYFGLDDLAPAARPVSAIIEQARGIIELQIGRLLHHRDWLLEHAA